MPVTPPPTLRLRTRRQQAQEVGVLSQQHAVAILPEPRGQLSECKKMILALTSLSMQPLLWCTLLVFT